MLKIDVNDNGLMKVSMVGNSSLLMSQMCSAVNIFYQRLDETDRKEFERLFKTSHSMIFSENPEEHIFDDIDETDGADKADIDELLDKAGALISALEDALEDCKGECKHKRN